MLCEVVMRGGFNDVEFRAVDQRRSQADQLVPTGTNLSPPHGPLVPVRHRRAVIEVQRRGVFAQLTGVLHRRLEMLVGESRRAFVLRATYPEETESKAAERRQNEAWEHDEAIVRMKSIFITQTADESNEITAFEFKDLS
jgi:hypothetical protein